MKIKVSELEGVALDWAVAKAEGLMLGQIAIEGVKNGFYNPTTNWAQGGPIIEREKITIVCAEGEYNYDKAGTPDCYDTYWVAEIGMQQHSTVYGSQGDNWGDCFRIYTDEMTGPTPLIAAMRCYCRAKLGPEIEVPEEVL